MGEGGAETASSSVAQPGEERFLMVNHSFTSFKSRFLHAEYPFGSEENTTFYVYVYDFRSPIWIVVRPSFSSLDWHPITEKHFLRHRSARPCPGIVHAAPAEAGTAAVLHHVLGVLPVAAAGRRHHVEDQAKVRPVPPPPAPLRRNGADGVAALLARPRRAPRAALRRRAGAPSPPPLAGTTSS